MPLDRNVTATQNTHILAIVNLGTFSAYFTLRISNYEIYMQERLSPLNVQNEKNIYPAASNDGAVIGLGGNEETQQEFETKYVFMYAVRVDIDTLNIDLLFFFTFC